MKLQDIWNKYHHKNQIKIKLFDKDFYLEKLTFGDMVDIYFLLIPHIKLIKKVQSEYQNENSYETFKFIINLLLDELDKETLFQIVSILFNRINVEIIKSFTIEDFNRNLAIIIRENELFEMYLLFKNLGLYNG